MEKTEAEDIEARVEALLAADDVAQLRDLVAVHGVGVLRWRGPHGVSLLRCCLEREDPALAVEAVRLGADVEAVLCLRAASGDRPLHGAASRGMIEAIRALVAAGATVDARNRAGLTPLRKAIDVGSVAAVTALLEAGASREWSGNGQEEVLSPMGAAAHTGHVGVLKCLLEAGAPVDDTGHNGATPLMVAAYTGRWSCVQVLMEAGADMSRRLADGRNAIDCARTGADPRIAEMMEAWVRRKHLRVPDSGADRSIAGPGL